MWVFLGLLGILSIIYLILQIAVFIVGMMIVGIEEIFVKDDYKEDEEGYLRFHSSMTLIDYIAFPVAGVVEILREKSYIKQWAKKNAITGKYSNRFKKESLQKTYDATYKEARKELIIKHAKKNANILQSCGNRYSDKSERINLYNPYTVPFEKALYQDTLLKTATHDSNAKNTVQSHLDELYKDEQLEPVSDEVFEKVMRSHYQTR